MYVGQYYVKVVDNTNTYQSPLFYISEETQYSQFYATYLSYTLFFYRAQRDGPNVDSSVLERQPSHLLDQSAYIYSTPSYNGDNVTIAEKFLIH